jgi:hypothetical protein
MVSVDSQSHAFPRRRSPKHLMFPSVLQTAYATPPRARLKHQGAKYKDIYRKYMSLILTIAGTLDILLVLVALSEFKDPLWKSASSSFRYQSS